MVQHFCRNSTLLRLSALSSHIHSPLLLLQDPHGHREARRGKARMEVVNRTFRSRFTLWRAGRFGELWERVKHDNARRSKTQEKRDNDQLQREAQRVARGYSLALLRNYAPAASPPSTQKRCRRCSSSSPPVNCLSTPPSSKPQRSNSSLQR